jgi:hypothetical protein
VCTGLSAGCADVMDIVLNESKALKLVRDICQAIGGGDKIDCARQLTREGYDNSREAGSPKIDGTNFGIEQTVGRCTCSAKSGI